MGFEEELAPLRERINNVDAQLVPLFEARMKVSGEIAEVKQRFGKPVFDAAREDAVIARAISRLADPANAEALRRFYRALMDLSKQRQHMSASRRSLSLIRTAEPWAFSVCAVRSRTSRQ